MKQQPQPDTIKDSTANQHTRKRRYTGREDKIKPLRKRGQFFFNYAIQTGGRGNIYQQGKPSGLLLNISTHSTLRPYRGATLKVLKIQLFFFCCCTSDFQSPVLLPFTVCIFFAGSAAGSAPDPVGRAAENRLSVYVLYFFMGHTCLYAQNA